MGTDKKKNRDQNRRVSKEEIRKKVSQLKEVETSKIIFVINSLKVSILAER